ncbi:hypothetical protein MAR_038255 [Mya arenaria]|uniref:Dynamin N-terminal domain-containing protein n=1 Tax=Mya arenaria TaxID=6604 RepID=A0ABY7FUR0_MYAAR|nr:hypothetical protein MAR_038255 [Mya arenaria]
MNSNASSDIRLEDVETMDLGAVCDFLEARRVSYSDVEDLEEMRDIVRRNLQQADSEPSDATFGSDNCSDDHITMTLNRDTVMKQELAEIYDKVIAFIKTGLNGDLIDELYGKNFAARLEVNQSELVHGDCPIVVAGETSAGKSSLLNLLLGADILPYSLLSSTSTICLLHNNRRTDRRRFVVYPKVGDPGECHNVEEGREKEALERLKRAWDIVEEREGRQPGTEKKVWEDTLDKLEKYFPNYNRDHVYKMCTTQASVIVQC